MRKWLARMGGRRLAAVMSVLFAAMVLSLVAGPASAWADPIIDLKATQKTNVTGLTSFQLGNATVTGDDSRIIVIDVTSGSFTLDSSLVAPAGAEVTSALDANGAYLVGSSVVAGGTYTYVSYKVPTSAASGTSAADLQTFLRSIKLSLDGGYAQRFDVMAITTPPTVSYGGTDYDITYLNKSAYAFIACGPISWSDAYAGAKTLGYGGLQGYLMTIETLGEHNLIYRLYNSQSGWLGGTRAVSSSTVLNGNTIDVNDDGTSDWGQNWTWVCGPTSTGKTFLTGSTYRGTYNNGSWDNTPAGVFNMWSNYQPDGAGGEAFREAFLQYGYGDNGTWNDLPMTYDTLIKGFYVEFTPTTRTATADTQVLDIDYELENVTSDVDHGQVIAGTPYSTTLTPAAGYALRSSGVSVRVGENLLDPSDYSFDAETGLLTIPSAKTMDEIVIGATATSAYDVTYDLDGGTVDGTNPTTYTDGDTFTLVNPTRDGYTFSGWSGTGLTGDANMEVTVAAGSTGARSYTAHWTKDEVVIPTTPTTSTTASAPTQAASTTTLPSTADPFSSALPVAAVAIGIACLVVAWRRARA